MSRRAARSRGNASLLAPWERSRQRSITSFFTGPAGVATGAAASAPSERETREMSETREMFDMSETRHGVNSDDETPGVRRGRTESRQQQGPARGEESGRDGDVGELSQSRAARSPERELACGDDAVMRCTSSDTLTQRHLSGGAGAALLDTVAARTQRHLSGGARAAQLDTVAAGNDPDSPTNTHLTTADVVPRKDTYANTRCSGQSGPATPPGRRAVVKGAAPKRGFQVAESQRISYKRLPQADQQRLLQKAVELFRKGSPPGIVTGAGRDYNRSPRLVCEAQRPAFQRLGEPQRPAFQRLWESQRPAYQRLGEPQRPAYLRLGEPQRPAYQRLGEPERQRLVQRAVDRVVKLRGNRDSASHARKDL